MSPTQQSNEASLPDFHAIAAPGRPPRRPLGKRLLIEVADVIDDDPDDAVLQIDRSEDSPQGEPRPRSILKNSTPIIASSTRLQDTAANTRRNSKVEVEESRYFTTAADILRVPYSSTHRVIPRRLSYLHSSRVEVAGSERFVLETSPQPPDYTNASQLETSDKAWPCRKLATVPKDLKALTRTISREHGTLSQSSRRRSSLPFRSPTKLH